MQFEKVHFTQRYEREAKHYINFIYLYDTHRHTHVKEVGNAGQINYFNGTWLLEKVLRIKRRKILPQSSCRKESLHVSR